MQVINLRDLDAVYAKMCMNMTTKMRISYCAGIIDLTGSFLNAGKPGKRGFNTRLAADTIAAARNELQILRNSIRF